MKLFKSLLFYLLCIAIAFSATGCSTKDKRVLDAIEVLTERWEDYYDEYKWDGNKAGDRYLEIVNTRIVNIKDVIESDKFAKRDKMFEDIDYIVEFELVSNHFDTTPYYFNAFLLNSVVVYKDGKTEVSDYNLFNAYRSATFSNDFSHIIESIEELHGEYDQVIKIEG